MKTVSQVDSLDMLPPSLVAAIRCPNCRVLLFRAEMGWVCPAGLDHTGIVSDQLLRVRIKEAMPGRPPKGWRKRTWQRWASDGASRLMRLVRQEWRQRTKKSRT